MHPPLLTRPSLYISLYISISLFPRAHQVLHLHVILELQVLLRLRLHAPCTRHPLRRFGVHHNRDYVLSPQRGRLPLAVGQLPLFRLNGLLRISLLHLLLLRQDEYVWTDADNVRACTLWFLPSFVLFSYRTVAYAPLQYLAARTRVMLTLL